jgi:hypothetical protein
MIKNPCYIYWDDTTIPEADRKVYIQCESCFAINKKGIRWPCNNYGKKTIKCNLCNTIIYKRIKKKKNEQKNNDQTAI